MKIKTITYGESRTLPHPTHQYANLKPHCSVEIELSDGDHYSNAIVHAKEIVDLILAKRAKDFFASASE